MAILEITKQTPAPGVIIENILYESSNVIKTSYNYNTQQLFVTFKKGNVYNYNAVPHSKYEDLKNAPSIGSFISREIIPNHTVVKKGEAPVEILNEMVNKITTFKNNATT